ncbi:MAG: prephenate dehydrogenase/arogenate dehydrogenase family protein [Pseudomonadaceae bacterium]|nr:prephenate dehydrogenase/arogenate dehydrogenase family protein [Pseudomonadaceae bacterium]
MTDSAFDKPVVILGAGGAIGRLVLSLLAGSDCRGFDLDADPQRAIVGAHATDNVVLDAVSDCAAVILCLPESAALDAIESLAPRLSSEQLLVDTLSIKSPFLTRCAELGLRCQHVSINPMFAPDLDPSGRAIATLVPRQGRRANIFTELLAYSGATLVDIPDISGDEHDRMTAALQVATHASILSFGLTLATLGYRANEASALWTPPHKTLLALLARIGTLSPEVYRDIQHEHPLAELVRSSAQSALQDIGSSTTPEAFADLVQRALDPLGASSEELAELCSEIFSR